MERLRSYEQEEHLEKKDPLTEEENFVFQKLKEKGFYKPDVELIPEDKKMLDKILKEHEIRKLEQGSKEKSELGEMLAGYAIEKFKWLGENCKVEVCSQFDDILNYSDLAIKTEHNGKESLIGIDITIAESLMRLRDKIDCLFKEIDRKTLGKLKYSEFNDSQKELQMIPRAIVKITDKELAELVELANKEETFNDKDAIEKLKNNKLQIDILENIAGQIGMQIHYVAHSILKEIDEHRKRGKAINTDQGGWEKINKVYFCMDGNVIELANAIKEARSVFEKFEFINSKILKAADSLLNAFEIINGIKEEKFEILQKEPDPTLQNNLISYAKIKEGKPIRLPSRLF